MRAPHATKGILDLDFTELLVGLGLDLLQQLALRRQDLFEGLLECWLGGRGVAACLHCANRVSGSILEVEDSIAYPMRMGERLRAIIAFVSNCLCN